MTRNTIALFLLLFQLNAQSQSILTALRFGSREEVKPGKNVLEVTTENTFYLGPTVEKTKEVTTFNKNNKVLAEARYDGENVLTARLTRVYDSTGVYCVARKLERWHPLMGHYSETALYEYDAQHFLVKITDKHDSDHIVRETRIINNDKGQPVELSIFADGKLSGRETARYDNTQNNAIIQYYGPDLVLVNTENVPIKIEAAGQDMGIDEKGAPLQSEATGNTVKYDSFGNWIKMERFENVNGKPVLSASHKRSIKYRKG